MKSRQEVEIENLKQQLRERERERERKENCEAVVFGGDFYFDRCWLIRL